MLTKFLRRLHELFFTSPAVKKTIKKTIPPKPKMVTDEKKPVKLPYFHRKLSDEDTKLLGDTAPKPITNAEANKPSVGGKSAWNSGGTWEERDFSKWAVSSMKQIFASHRPSASLNGFSLTVGESSSGSCVSNKTMSVEGTANVTHIRGTARFLYELCVDGVPFSCAHTDMKVDGLVKVSDIINDQFDDIEIAITEMKARTAPSDVNKRIQEFRSALTKGKEGLMKKALKEVVTIFEREFQTMYKEKIGEGKSS